MEQPNQGVPLQPTDKEKGESSIPVVEELSVMERNAQNLIMFDVERAAEIETVSKLVEVCLAVTLI